ncbi:MAG: hypothetical protein ABS46_09650 [Cytophagaceae bacterium SCN 52-12]|nr:MAG: hypothetical protein ABS46_09650 [Cytophagaceae bacterium SCN 52-12]
MKMMLLFVLFWTNIPAIAQKKIERKLNLLPGQEVDLDLKFADSIQVKYWDRPEVYVVADVKINNGRLNDALLVKTSETKQAVKLAIDLDSKLLQQGEAEDCPDNKTAISKKGNLQFVTCMELRYEVYLPRQASLRLSTINGNIHIEGSGAPVFVKTISGFVDMSWPASKGADLSLRSITGEVYSDLAIRFADEKKKNPIVGYNIKGSAKGGGPLLHLESVSNDIYLRSK